MMKTALLAIALFLTPVLANATFLWRDHADSTVATRTVVGGERVDAYLWRD